MRRGLIVGINYTGTGNDLQGCLNDANTMQALLRDVYKFDEIKLVLEQEATTEGIRAAFKWLTSNLSVGDTIVFHYSGHGSQLPSKFEGDGYEEIICPYDLNWKDKVITDNELRGVFGAVPNGVNTTVILDCCHSGSGLDQDNSYTPSIKVQSTQYVVNSGRFMAPPAGLVHDTDHVVDWHATRDINASAVLVAACHADQTSADAFIGGIHQGAHTCALDRAARINPTCTYRTLVDDIAEYMVENGFDQRPEIDGFPGLFEEKFLSPFGLDIVGAAPASLPYAMMVTEPSAVQKIVNGRYFGPVLCIGIAILFFIFTR